MKIHLLAAIFTIIAGVIFNVNSTEWIAIIVCIALVWAAEIGNTLVEKYLDTYHPERNPDVGAIKDMSAAAVLVLAIAAGVIGGFIFIPKLISFL